MLNNYCCLGNILLHESKSKEFNLLLTHHFAMPSDKLEI